MSVLAVIGATSLYLLYGWLLSVIVASDLSDRKGYGERPGLATGMLLATVGTLIWLAMPARPESLWKRHVRAVDLATAVAAILAFGTLFLGWYSGGASFFDELRFYDLLLPIGAAVGYGQLHVRASGRSGPRLGPAVVGASLVALLVAIVNVASPPDGASVEIWAYLGLVFGLLMTVGAALAAIADRSASPATEAPAATA